MNTTKAVYNKLFSKKTELETHKVELGLIQELNAEFREYNSKALDAGGFILRAKQTLSKNINLSVKMSKDLGITDKTLNSLEKKSESSLKDFKNQLKKIESL